MAKNHIINDDAARKIVLQSRGKRFREVGIDSRRWVCMIEAVIIPHAMKTNLSRNGLLSTKTVA